MLDKIFWFIKLKIEGPHLPLHPMAGKRKATYLPLIYIGQAGLLFLMTFDYFIISEPKTLVKRIYKSGYLLISRRG
jgi:hypothetical protein